MRAPKGFIDESDPKVAKVGHPAPAWVVCYADLMTELVCFFVILYALSAALNKDVQKAQQEIKEMMDKGEVKGEVKVDKDGLKITIEEQGSAGFFEVGAAEPTPTIDAMLAKVIPSLRKLTQDHELLVEGHTDNQRIHNQYFDSNWELSTARATSVARLLIENYQIPEAHVGAVGYGGTRPVAPNDTPENRAKNRRVVFFIKSSKIPKKPGEAATPAAATPAPAPAAPVPPTEAKVEAEAGIQSPGPATPADGEGR